MSQPPSTQSNGDNLEEKKRLFEANMRNKRFRNQMRVTPWKDDWELERVGFALLSVLNPIENGDTDNTDSTILEALDMVAVWKARSEILPHAVESTAALAHVFWRDQSVSIPLQSMKASSTSIVELRLAYSSAIVRCINGFADALQQQRSVAAPVSVLCGQMGIPSWLVDIRHEASHNTLPTLPVLRLAASTLLQYLQAEFWTPTCSTIDTPTTLQSSSSSDQEQVNSSLSVGLSILLQYEAAATMIAAEMSPLTVDSTTSQDISTNPQNSTNNKEGVANDKSEANSTNDEKDAPHDANGRKSPRRPKSPAAKPFDTFFGDDSDDGSSDDDGDVDQWDDPMSGSLWGNSVGTSTNRFAALEPPPKKKTLPKEKTKPPKKKEPPPIKKKSPPKAKPKPKPVPQKKRKKRPGEKYPLDYAKDFVEFVPPREGYATALQFLVWGGIGGTPPGMGVLIPESATEFPKTNKGALKSWQRHSTLLEVLGSTWPGFCSALLVHLVDHLLATEEILVQSAGTRDPPTNRKLFFLTAWIRALLSEHFVGKIFPETKTSKNKKKKYMTSDTVLASYSSLEVLQYPLNALCTRCEEVIKDQSPRRKTSREILSLFREILGNNRITDVDVGDSKLPMDIPQESVPTSSTPTAEETPPSHGPELRDGKMSLDDFESMLSEDEVEQPSAMATEEDTAATKGQGGTTELSTVPALPTTALAAEGQPISSQGMDLDTVQKSLPAQRPVWTRCITWDPCSIGALPAFPS